MQWKTVKNCKKYHKKIKHYYVKVGKKLKLINDVHSFQDLKLWVRLLHNPRFFPYMIKAFICIFSPQKDVCIICYFFFHMALNGSKNNPRSQSICFAKQLKVFPVFSVRDASPLQVTIQHWICQCVKIQMHRKRHQKQSDSKGFESRPLDPEPSSLTNRAPSLQHFTKVCTFMYMCINIHVYMTVCSLKLNNMLFNL